MSLNDLYNRELNIYRKTGKLQATPDMMLTMLLLDKKEDFFPSDVNIKHFCQDYEDVIKTDVSKVEDDFGLESPKDDDEFWQTYGSAIEILFDGVTQMSLNNGEDVFQYYCGENKVKKIGGIK